MDKYDCEVHHGFFWYQPIESIIVADGRTALVHHNVFYKKPKWYQFGKWLLAFKLWVTM